MGSSSNQRYANRVLSDKEREVHAKLAQSFMTAAAIMRPETPKKMADNPTGRVVLQAFRLAETFLYWADNVGRDHRQSSDDLPAGHGTEEAPL